MLSVTHSRPDPIADSPEMLFSEAPNHALHRHGAVQDFIPQEELGKLLSASGDKLAQEQAAALEQASRIQARWPGCCHHGLQLVLAWLKAKRRPPTKVQHAAASWWGWK